MTQQRSQMEWVWLDARETVTVTDLSRACGLTAQELAELVEYGALTPVEKQHEDGEARADEERSFSAASVAPLRTARKLRAAYDLDVFTVSLLLAYTQRIDALERELRSLRAKMPS